MFGLPELQHYDAPLVLRSSDSVTLVSRPEPCFLDAQERIGAPGGRLRWRSFDGERLYEWDSLHGEIEVYTKRGRHLGALDPVNGVRIKGPEKGRRIDV